MIWVTFLAVSLALSFAALGFALAVISYLKIALLMALLVIAGFVIAFIWRKYVAPRLNKLKTWQPKQLISKRE